MKKLLILATVLLACGCYAPLNNSGVSTTKAWLDIPAKKTDFDGKQFDSCYQFRLRFVPADAEAALDLREACINACCWRSDKDEVILDFNKNFEWNLKYYGRADKYTPGKITLKVSHSNLLNTTAVKVSPRGAISRNGTVKLKRETVEDPVRLAQIESQARLLQARRNARLADERAAEAEAAEIASYDDPAVKQRALDLVQRTEGTRIDRYFYDLNKTYNRRGYVFLLSERFYSAAPLGNYVYRVACNAKVQSGVNAHNLKNRTVSCGVWRADLKAGTVSPADGTARRIKTLN